MRLLNSTPMVDGEQRDILDDDELAAVLEGLDADRASGSLEAMRAVRTLVQRLIVGEARPEEAQRWLEPVVQVPRLTADGLSWDLEGADEAIAPARAVLEWARLDRDAPGRLRACANEECAKFLLDRSRGNTARWCSMAGCGNRMKARRHARRGVEG